jgi:hypothetical protein
MTIKNHSDIEEVKATGYFIIIDAGTPAKMGEEITSPAGIVTGKRSAGEVSQWGEVVSVGNKVTGFSVGDLVAMPLMQGGSISRVPHPDFIAGLCSDIDSPTNYVAAHEDSIRAKYIRK